jgi:demethylmenaquinone methyltransferase/2-methoxy-6-polyprenyl-1,4-benzoquinol methylase
MPPDRRLAIEQYRTYAKQYDLAQKRNPEVERQRARVVELLRLQRGDTVLDVGCGTGLNFPLLEDAVGAAGRIIGIDLSPEMLDLARERVAAQGWRNVTLVESAVEDAAIPGEFDAVLFCLTHDVLQSPEALANVFRNAKPGARVAALGFKSLPWWALPWSFVVRGYTRNSMTTRENFDRPWRNLERYVPNLQIETAFMGALYVAWGTAKA